MDTGKHIRNIITGLDTLKPDDPGKQVFTGFDGFVDKIQRVVKSASGKKTMWFETLDDFGDHLVRLAGKSGQVELVTQETKLGGNAPIMSNSLGHLSILNHCMASLGVPELHDAFSHMPPSCSIISICNPAETNALEFDDGKLIMSELSSFRKLDWNFLKEATGTERIIEVMDSCRIIALVDWSNLIHATGLWRGIVRDVLPRTKKQERVFFFDLADPSKKSDREILEVLDLMAEFRAFGKVLLGLNENETGIVGDAIGKGKKDGRPPESWNAREKGEYVFRNTNIDELLVHPVNRCILFTGDSVHEVPGKVVKKPKISTGGGDNLNAGICLGILAGLPPEEILITGMATSGAYVQNGTSPDREALTDYLRKMYD